MSGASWEPDPKLTREKHNWVFASAYPQEWGCTIKLRCTNPGCPTTRSYGIRREEWALADRSPGLCFNTAEAKMITDRDGNRVRTDDK